MQFHYSELFLNFVLLIFLIRTLIIELFFQKLQDFIIHIYYVFINASDILQNRCDYPPTRWKILHEPADN